MPTLFGQSYSKRQLLDLVGDMSQVAHARKAELVEGNERGADLIEVFNASGLAFSILPGRALDIASAHYKGMSLCFRGTPATWGRLSTNRKATAGCAASMVVWCSVAA